MGQESPQPNEEENRKLPIRLGWKSIENEQRFYQEISLRIQRKNRHEEEPYWNQIENTRRIDQERFDEEQNRKDHFEEEIRNGTQEFQKRRYQKMDARGYKSKKKSWHHWLLRSQEGKCPLQRSPKNLRRINQPVSFAPFTLLILETISTPLFFKHFFQLVRSNYLRIVMFIEVKK